MPKAVRYDEFGGIDVLRVDEVARPVPGDVDAFIDTHGDGYVELALALVLGVAPERIDTSPISPPPRSTG